MSPRLRAFRHGPAPQRRRRVYFCSASSTLLNMTAPEILAALRARANPANTAGMARYGINTEHAYGVPVYELRAMAKPIGRDHVLAQELWASGIHEARILATIIEEPKQ